MEEESQDMLNVAMMARNGGLFSAMDNPQTINIPPAELALVRHYLQEELKLTGPTPRKLQDATHRAMTVNKTNTPSTAAIANELVSHHACECLVFIAPSVQIQASMHIMEVFGECPSCSRIQMVSTYWTTEKKMPSREELGQMMQSYAEISRRPDDYCEEKKIRMPTPRLELLAVEKNTQERHCSICQDALHVGQDMYKLPCGDCFHASVCLGNDNSVLTWMQMCKRCPNCNQDIELNVKQETLCAK